MWCPGPRGDDADGNQGGEIVTGPEREPSLLLLDAVLMIVIFAGCPSGLVPGVPAIRGDDADGNRGRCRRQPGREEPAHVVVIFPQESAVLRRGRVLWPG